MDTPRYFALSDRTILIRPSSMETTSDLPGLRMSDAGWTVRLANAKKWAEPVTMVVFGHRGNGDLSLVLAPAVHAEIALFHLPEAHSGPFSLSLELGEGASLSLTEVVLAHPGASLEISRFASLASASRLAIRSGLSGAAQIRWKDEWDLFGERASLESEFLAVGGAKDEIAVRQTVRHLSPRTASRLSNLLVSAGSARLKVDVSGIIAKGMAGADCKQSNRGVLLGETGVIEVDPKLLIDEFDVEAGHGCAIGQVNADEMYYLQSRGLDETAARRLILAGYLEPFLGNIAVPEFARRFSRALDVRLKGVDL